MSTIYDFEHRILPNWTYHSTHFFNDLINVGEGKTLYNAAKTVYEDRKEELPYKEEDFGGFHARLDVDTVVVVLRFPKPEDVPLCYCALVFLDAGTSRLAYYTLEKGKDPTDGREMQFLCGWDEKGEHRNYGSVYTDTTVLGDNLLIRYFYTRFRDLKNVKIPQQPKEENDNTRVLKCPACKHEIIFDASEIGEGDSLVVLCDFCARIYELSYRNNEFLIQNRIKEETEKTEG